MSSSHKADMASSTNINYAMTSLCRQRFVQHATVVLGVVGLLSFAYLDSRNSHGSNGPVWMGGGIVDPSGGNGVLVPIDDDEAFIMEDADDLPQLTLWLPVGIQAEEEENDASHDAHNEKGRRRLSFSWHVSNGVNERTTNSNNLPSVVDAIPGCPHCGQVDDDDVYISQSGQDEENVDANLMEKRPSHTTWKVIHLQPTALFDQTEHRHLRGGQDPKRRCTRAYCDNRTMRWHLEHNQVYMEQKLCHQFSKLLRNDAHGLLDSSNGKMDVAVMEDGEQTSKHSRDEEDAFFSARERMQDAVYGEEESGGPANGDDSKNNSSDGIPMTMYGAKCRLQVESPKPVAAFPSDNSP